MLKVETSPFLFSSTGKVSICFSAKKNKNGQKLKTLKIVRKKLLKKCKIALFCQKKLKVTEENAEYSHIKCSSLFVDVFVQ
jgi:hypothetical protein